MEHRNVTRHFQALDVERGTPVHQMRSDNRPDSTDDLSLKHPVANPRHGAGEFGVLAIKIGPGFYQDIECWIPVRDEVRGCLYPGVYYLPLFAGEHFATFRRIDVDATMVPVAPVFPERTGFPGPGYIA